MLTGTATTQVTATNNHAHDHAEHSTTPGPSSTYLCTSCQVTFEDGQHQRAHMKESWHVYNIKRRIASLPPIPRDAFDERVVQRPQSRGSSHSSTASDEEGSAASQGEQAVSPFECLFCNHSFSSDDAGFASNLEHMRTAHSMSIPEPGQVLDLQSFVSYLATEIKVWHECLYCGATKPSIDGVQSHMRDKGHCALNFEREPELLDFWEDHEWLNSDDDAAKVDHESLTRLSATELRFSSGRVIASRHDTSSTKRKAARKAKDSEQSALKALIVGEEGEGETGSSSPPLTDRQPLPSRQLVRRDEMGITGVSPQQRQALVLAEKKAQRSEAAARRAREWVYAKGANLQKHDQIDTTGKRGKQNHKLQPR